MKCILTLLVILLQNIEAASQYRNSPAFASPATDYLEKSRKQKTSAWILLVGGGLVSSIGMVVGMSEMFTDLFDAAPDRGSAGPTLLVVGVASMAGSIPLFIASGKNRRKAAGEIALKWENVVVNPGPGFVRHYPAIGISIKL